LGVSLKRLMITKRDSHPLVVGAAVACALCIIVMTAPRSSAAGAPVHFAEVRRIVDQRCIGCHALKPTIAGIVAPPKGLVLDSADKIAAMKDLIKLQAVTTKTMPLGNLTQMT